MPDPLVITLRIPGHPRPKGRPRFSTKTGHTYTPKKTAQEEAVIRQMAAAVMERESIEGLWEGPVHIKIVAGVQKPQDWWGGREPTGTNHGDWDNIGKLVTDALQGIVFKNDAQIISAVVVKRYADLPNMIVQITLMRAVLKPKKEKKRKIDGDDVIC